jgi:hypothetical protein
VKKRLLRIFVAALAGLLILAGVAWLLSQTLGNHEAVYAGKSLSGWKQQLDSRDLGASNQAYQVLSSQIIPQLVDQMFHDTHDSKLRMSLIKILNGIPGVEIKYIDALGRREGAAHYLGSFGPAARAAVPSLIQVLKGPDLDLHEKAVEALGHIHSDPEVVIPLLIPYLTNDSVNDAAATALGSYGSLAKEAFQRIVPMLKSRDKGDRAAARSALKKIDPAAAAKAGVK